MGRERRKQDNAATAAEDRQELLHEEEGRPDVADEQGIEGLDVEIRCWSEPREARIVDQHVDLTDAVDQALKVRRIAQVGCNEGRSTARDGDRCNRLRAALSVPAMNEDLCPLPSQLQGNGSADSGGGTRNQCSLVLEL